MKPAPGLERLYSSKEAAYEDLRFVGTILPQHEERYRANVDRYLKVLEDGSVHLLRKTKTFVMWWQPCELEEIALSSRESIFM